MLLSGYGVELAIKSTEYKAVDDTQVKGALAQLLFKTIMNTWWIVWREPSFLFIMSLFCLVLFSEAKSEADGGDDDADEVQGFLFGKLKWANMFILLM